MSATGNAVRRPARFVIRPAEADDLDRMHETYAWHVLNGAASFEEVPPARDEFRRRWQAIVDLGVGVEMCAPRSGNQKGSVERLVGWVKSSFFKPRKFLDEADLHAQLADWLVEANTKTASRATGVIP